MKQTGSFTIMTAILMPTIFIYFAVIIEINNYYLTSQQLATSTDIAALAGAAQLGIANNDAVIASSTNYFNAFPVHYFISLSLFIITTSSRQAKGFSGRRAGRDGRGSVGLCTVPLGPLTTSMSSFSEGSLLSQWRLREH